jgi:signal peptidase II
MALAAVGVALDQATKYLAQTRLEPGEPVPLLGSWFQLRLYYNTGAAFSLGESMTVVFAALAVIVIGAVLWWAWRHLRRLPWVLLAGSGLAGVAGNLVDRLTRAPGPFRGHVVDFLYVKHFATFNVADICLTVTAGLIVIFILRDVAWEEAPPAAVAAAPEPPPPRPVAAAAPRTRRRWGARLLYVAEALAAVGLAVLAVTLARRRP